MRHVKSIQRWGKKWKTSVLKTENSWLSLVNIREEENLSEISNCCTSLFGGCSKRTIIK